MSCDREKERSDSDSSWFSVWVASMLIIMCLVDTKRVLINNTKIIVLALAGLGCTLQLERDRKR